MLLWDDKEEGKDGKAEPAVIRDTYGLVLGAYISGPDIPGLLLREA
jgi:hypothetical protein